jgi:uncharacterized membrane protein YhhN
VRARVLAAAGLLAVALYFAGLAWGAPALRFVVKPVPVLALGVWVLTDAAGRGRYARFLALGLGLSATGDVLLEQPGRFLVGLAAFLLAHLAYVAAFLSETRRPALARALPFVAYAALLFSLLLPGLGALLVPVAVYVAALTAMQWRAAACVGATARGRAAEWTALAGAVLFALSDGLIGLDRFHAPIAHARYAIMLLYWLGQAGLALSARSVGRP